MKNFVRLLRCRTPLLERIWVPHMVLEHALKPFVQNSKPSWCPYHPHYIQFVRERARYGPVEVQNGIAKKQLLSTLKIICKYVYDDIFAAISLKQAFWRARHLN